MVSGILVVWPRKAQFLLSSSSQAFTVVTVFSSMTFALKVTPFSVKSLSEGSVAVDRFKVGGFLSSSASRPVPDKTTYLYSSGSHRLTALGFCLPSAFWQVGKKGAMPGGGGRGAGRGKRKEPVEKTD